jgi:hypothetical protein
MNTISNASIAKKYGVSRPTVSRWVDAALLGKNNLQLSDEEKPVKYYRYRDARSELYISKAQYDKMDKRFTIRETHWR